MRECLGGGEVSRYRDGVNEEPLQEAAGRLLVDLEPGDSIVGGGTDWIKKRMRRSFHRHLRESLVRMWSLRDSQDECCRFINSRFVPLARSPLLFIQLHPASQYHQYIHKVRGGWEEVEKKRRKNAQQPEERKEKMRRGLLHSGWSLLLGWWRVFSSPSGSNSVYLMIFYLLRHMLKHQLSGFYFIHFCDRKLLILILKKRVFWEKYELRSWKQNHNHSKVHIMHHSKMEFGPTVAW